VRIVERGGYYQGIIEWWRLGGVERYEFIPIEYQPSLLPILLPHIVLTQIRGIVTLKRAAIIWRIVRNKSKIANDVACGEMLP
jgi:hypothetical protein